MHSRANKKAPLCKGSEAGAAGVNDSPVGCQSRGLTEPAGETLSFLRSKND